MELQFIFLHGNIKRQTDGAGIMRLNYYEILGVPKHATDEQIKNAYRKLAMRHHPDRNDNAKLSEEIFKKVQAAFENLSDPVKRREHDECLMGRRPFPQESTYTPQPAPKTDAKAQARAKARAYAQAYTYAQGSSRSASLLSGWRKLLIFLMLFLLIGIGGAFYLYKFPHANSLGAAVPTLISTPDPANQNVEVTTTPLTFSDTRVDAAMRHLYSASYLQDRSSKCWVGANDPQSGMPYCMQILTAYLITIKGDELIYILTIEKASHQRLPQRDTSHFPMLLGVAVFDAKNAQVLASEPYIWLPADIGRLTAFTKPVRIACNGAFAWPLSFQSKRSILYAQKGQGIANLFHIIPAQYLDSNSYTHTFLPTQKECIYEMHIQNRQDPAAAPLIATFDKSTWSYRLP